MFRRSRCGCRAREVQLGCKRMRSLRRRLFLTLFDWSDYHHQHDQIIMISNMIIISESSSLSTSTITTRRTPWGGACPRLCLIEHCDCQKEQAGEKFRTSAPTTGTTGSVLKVVLVFYSSVQDGQENQNASVNESWQPFLRFFTTMDKYMYFIWENHFGRKYIWQNWSKRWVIVKNTWNMNLDHSRTLLDTFGPLLKILEKPD